jgi:hypothetical protein
MALAGRRRPRIPDVHHVVRPPLRDPVLAHQLGGGIVDRPTGEDQRLGHLAQEADRQVLSLAVAQQLDEVTEVPDRDAVDVLDDLAERVGVSPRQRVGQHRRGDHDKLLLRDPGCLVVAQADSVPHTVETAFLARITLRTQEFVDGQSSSPHATPGRIIPKAISRARSIAPKARMSSGEGAAMKKVRSPSAAYPLTRKKDSATWGPSRSRSFRSRTECGCALLAGVRTPRPAAGTRGP